MTFLFGLLVGVFVTVPLYEIFREACAAHARWKARCNLLRPHKSRGWTQ